MSYQIISINTASPDQAKSKVLIIYTGGTFGMAYDARGVLIPFDFSLILHHLPALRSLQLDLTVISFDQPIDSSNIGPTHWKEIGQIIFDHYADQDGFVVLHGTDTMSFTASALSFMLQGLSKPVVFTGAQLPISEPRSDARENLITALEIASAKTKEGKAMVPEVCLYFDSALLRGNRSRKVESMHFDAFQSENYPALAKAGVAIDYNDAAIHKVSVPKALKLRTRFDTGIAILKLFPGIPNDTIEAILSTRGLRALVIETFGSGNAPYSPWLKQILKDRIEQGLIVLNISQCPGGMVEQGRYETGKWLEEIGVISGRDMTSEAAVPKLMILIGEQGVEKAKELIGKPLAGEMSEY